MRQKNRGFTLIELLIVLVIIGLLLALITPGIAKTLGGARRAACMNSAKNVILGIILIIF